MHLCLPGLDRLREILTVCWSCDGDTADLRIACEVEKIINQSNKIPKLMDPYVKGQVQDSSCMKV